MTIDAESSTAIAGGALDATNSSIDVLKQGATSFADRAGQLADSPTVDVMGPVSRYFSYVQTAVDLNRDAAIRWAEMVSSLTTTLHDQAKSFGDTMKNQLESSAETAVDEAETVEQLVHMQAERAEQAEESDRQQARPSRRAEHARAERARDQYQDLIKAELYEELSERNSPKTVTIEEIVEGLVDAGTAASR